MAKRFSAVTVRRRILHHFAEVTGKMLVRKLCRDCTGSGGFHVQGEGGGSEDGGDEGFHGVSAFDD